MIGADTLFFDPELVRLLRGITGISTFFPEIFPFPKFAIFFRENASFSGKVFRETRSVFRETGNFVRATFHVLRRNVCLHCSDGPRSVINERLVGMFTGPIYNAVSSGLCSIIQVKIRQSSGGMRAGCYRHKHNLKLTSLSSLSTGNAET